MLCLLRGLRLVHRDQLQLLQERLGLCRQHREELHQGEEGGLLDGCGARGLAWERQRWKLYGWSACAAFLGLHLYALHHFV